MTPDSLLALHDAGYRAVREQLGERAGRVLDVGCGSGFESVRLAGAGRRVLGVDYDASATAEAARHGRARGLAVARMDSLFLGLVTGAFDFVCSSHVVEHFEHPEAHVAEVARVVAPGGTAFFLTPNAPADFENPFHLHLFGPEELRSLLARWFGYVEVHGIDASSEVKEDLAARRAKAKRLLALDVLDLRHRVPRSWYVGAYSRILPLAYRALAPRAAGGATGITADDWFVTGSIDDTTPVLFGTCRLPGRTGSRSH